MSPPPLEEGGLYIQALSSADRILWRNGRFSYLHPLQATLVLSLLGGAASNEDLIEALYSSDPEGGPLWALMALRHIIWRTRERLESLDMQITCRRGIGYILEPS